MTIEYDKRFVRIKNHAFKPPTCCFCNKKIKEGEITEFLIINNSRAYFCEHHLSAWINKVQREFLLSKL
jgi:hypothetical protein